MVKKPLICGLIFALLVFTGLSCKQRLKTAAWDSQFLLPIANTQLTIYNLLPDSLLSRDSSHLLNLVYRTNLYSYNKSTEIHIPDTTVQYNFKLDSIKLSDKSLNYSYSLGKFALSAGLIGGSIIAANGGTLVIPALSGLSSGNFNIDAQSFFHNATLRQGFMDLQITNNFPVEFDNVVFELRNQSSNTLIIRDSFPKLKVDTTYKKTYDLNGKVLEGLMVGKIISMNTPGSNGNSVPIDTGKALNMLIRVYKMKVQTATAIFPAQNLVTDSADAPYNIMGGVKLKYVILRKGNLTIHAVSTIKDTLHFIYTLPYVTDSAGNPIYIKDFVPPAPAGHNTSITHNYNLKGFKVDLEGKKHDTVNTFYHSLILRIDSTGIIRTLSLSDSLYILYTLDSLLPQYAEGNLGTDTFKFSGGAKFDFLNRIKSGTLGFNNVNVSFNLTNYIGADGAVKVNYLYGKNVRTGNTPTYLTSTLFNSPIIIPRATQSANWLVNNKLDYTKLNPSVTLLSLNKSNSNINTVFSNVPDSFKFSITTNLIPKSNPKWLGDFVYSDRSLNVNMDVKVPLSLIAHSLTLEDTVAANLSSLAFEANSNKNGITDAILYLLIDNGFPIKSNVQVYFYTANYAFVDSLFLSPQTIMAAPTDNACYVSNPLRTNLQTHVTQLRLNKWKNVSHAIVKSVFDTQGTGTCNGQPLNIYSDYKLKVALTAKLTYHFARN